MKYYVGCTNCGYELLQAEAGSCIEIECPNCHKYLIIEIEQDQITIKQALPTE